MTVAIHRRIFEGIKGLAEDVTIRAVRQQRHLVVEVSRPGVPPRRMPLAISPKNEEHAIRNSINQARKLLEIT